MRVACVAQIGSHARASPAALQRARGSYFSRSFMRASPPPACSVRSTPMTSVPHGRLMHVPIDDQFERQRYWRCRLRCNRRGPQAEHSGAISLVSTRVRSTRRRCLRVRGLTACDPASHPRSPLKQPLWQPARRAVWDRSAQLGPRSPGPNDYETVRAAVAPTGSIEHHRAVAARRTSTPPPTYRQSRPIVRVYS